MKKQSDIVISAIIDLINTSPDYCAWVEAPLGYYIDENGRKHIPSITKFPNSEITVYIVGPDNITEQIVIKETTLKIGQHEFDLNDTESINKIEQLLGCNQKANPTFDPINAISKMVQD